MKRCHKINKCFTSEMKKHGAVLSRKTSRQSSRQRRRRKRRRRLKKTGYRGKHRSRKSLYKVGYRRSSRSRNSTKVGHRSPSTSHKTRHRSPTSNKAGHRSPIKSPKAGRRSPSTSHKSGHRSPSRSPNARHRSSSRSPKTGHRSSSTSHKSAHRSPSRSPKAGHRSPSTLHKSTHRSTSTSHKSGHRSLSTPHKSEHRSHSRSHKDSHHNPKPSENAEHRSHRRHSSSEKVEHRSHSRSVKAEHRSSSTHKVEHRSRSGSDRVEHRSGSGDRSGGFFDRIGMGAILAKQGGGTSVGKQAKPGARPAAAPAAKGGKGGKGKGKGGGKGGGPGVGMRLVSLLVYLAIIYFLSTTSITVFKRAKAFYDKWRKQSEPGFKCPIDCSETVTGDCRFVEKVVKEADLVRGHISSNLWTFPLQWFSHSTFKQVKRIDFLHLTRKPEKFALVQGQLWIPAYKDERPCIMVYTLEGKYQKNIFLSSMTTVPNALAEWRPPKEKFHVSSLVFVAAYNGLFVISLDSFIIRLLEEGSFSDVCVSGEKIFALDFTKHIVYGYTHNGTLLKQTETVPLTVVEPNDYMHYRDTIQYHDGNLYVVDTLDDNLQKLKTEKEQFSSVGKYGNSGKKGGELRRARLCGYDTYGTILVCDQVNRRLQLLNSFGKWTISELNQLSFYPFAIVQMNHTFFWIQDWLAGNMYLYQFV